LVVGVSPVKYIHLLHVRLAYIVDMLGVIEEPQENTYIMSRHEEQTKVVVCVATNGEMQD